MVSDRLKVGIIGCGAVAELAHLPTLTKHPLVSVYALVDKNEERAKELAEKFCLDNTYDNYEDIYEKVDMAVIALPNHLHAKPTMDFLQHDVNVLCEKPMALSVSECKSMIQACEKSKAKLMISHQRRFMSNIVLARRMIDSGSLGDLTEYNCIVGAKFRWPTQTGFYFKKEEAGGGVLIDMGVHILDLLLWFFGDVEDLKYKAEDTMGKGVEDNVSISFTHKNSAKGEMKLSRTEVLENKLMIKGEEGWINIGIFDPTQFEFQSNKSKVSLELGKLNVKTKNNDPFRDQITHFVNCIKSDTKPLISGIDGLKTIKIVEECYRQAQT
jgi:predicted dehydrogenase